MFGILRPCRHSLSGDLASEWLSHLCGLCLALRDEFGQMARTATNYDGLVVSALTSAQNAPGVGTRTAGPCPLRRMRRAEIAEGAGARLAASVSLLLASGKITDHIDDGDGAYARWPVRAAASQVARRWSEQARRSGDALAFDSDPLVAVAERQREVERVGATVDVLTVTGPTEDATGQAFAHTALLAERPENEVPLREAGCLFGRIAHLLDAVEDLVEDRERGTWNPIVATRTGIVEVRDLCEDAMLGVRLALDEARFDDDRLVRALLGQELQRAVDRTFSAHTAPASGEPESSPPHSRDSSARHSRHGRASAGSTTGRGAHGGGDTGVGSGGGGYCSDMCTGHDSYHRPAREQGGCCSVPRRYNPPASRGLFGGCVVATFMCCTCQQPCRNPYPGPWSGKRRDAWCGDCCDGNCCSGRGGSHKDADADCDCCDCDCE